MLEQKKVLPEIGICVSKDVQDASGRLLIKAGTELSAKHIRALKMWGIGSVIADVDVDIEEAARSPILTVVQQEALRARVDLRFQFAPTDHPVMDRLYACSLARCVRLAIGQEESHAQ